MSRLPERNYKNAIAILNSRRRPTRPSCQSLANIPELGPSTNTQDRSKLKGSPSIIGMREWLAEIGHNSAALDKLNIIHIAGTKGKGSTCAFTESFLRTFGQRTGFPAKTGLYTSPHLRYPEERIRLNFQPISRSAFTEYFFDVWDALTRTSTGDGRLPRYLQLMAVVAFHAFICEGVDAAIVETHHGGEYDATNVIERPVVTAITSLGMDHTKQLGPTIENIAWHKAGIFKRGSLAFSTVQDGRATRVIEERALERDVGLQLVHMDEALPPGALQLTPDVQRQNCSLALAAANGFLQAKAPGNEKSLSADDISDAVTQFSWPGRFQIITQGRQRLFLDGAHNEMSVEKAADWFTRASESQSERKRTRVLLFGQVSEQRDSSRVLERLGERLKHSGISAVVFTAYDPDQDFDEPLALSSPSETDLMAGDFVDIWARVSPASRIYTAGNAEVALGCIHDMYRDEQDVDVLVTGSQHLIGAVLFALDQTPFHAAD